MLQAHSCVPSPAPRSRPTMTPVIRHMECVFYFGGACGVKQKHRLCAGGSWRAVGVSPPVTPRRGIILGAATLQYGLPVRNGGSRLRLSCERLRRDRLKHNLSAGECDPVGVGNAIGPNSADRNAIHLRAAGSRARGRRSRQRRRATAGSRTVGMGHAHHRRFCPLHRSPTLFASRRYVLIAGESLPRLRSKVRFSFVSSDLVHSTCQ